MSDAVGLLKSVAEFATRHEALLGRIAIRSAQIERSIDLLYGYVFNLKNEHWSVLTRNIRSVQTKIDILIQALAQDICIIDKGTRELLTQFLKDLKPFFELRNSVVHGQIQADWEGVVRIIEGVNAEAIDDETIHKIDVLLASKLCVPRFDPKTSEVIVAKYEVDDINRIVAGAEKASAEIVAIQEKIRDQFDWISIRMPRSELRKLER